ncbi:hypothetical protein K488DRAFT_79938 [Vararia minispora EC-137]|uniref:Uncharacterized protein n=1 Tax=Vararia minispora EC-137 TaxID=1314806 RepID=A0ACB8QDD3_9AGAM|nr:hypothetical protein K488DRAFT_79938 [Vararia minispora EC-137]
MVDKLARTTQHGAILFEPDIVYPTPPSQPTTHRTMSSVANFLSRSKLQSKLQLASGSGARDNGSLHRWVLLKNSIVRTEPTPVPPPEPEPEPELDEEHDSFMFPDAGVLAAPGAGLEQQWFDSLLETLDDASDEDDCEPPLPALPDSDDDEDCLFSPSTSPMSSSDDLVHIPVSPAPAYYPPPVALPFPPFDRTPLLIGPSPRPFFDAVDVDDLPMPDAIADDSDADDDSDALSTPSLLRSSVSQPLLRRPPLQQPRVVDPDDDDAGAFFFDGLPFPFMDAHDPLYPPQEC